jgi:hypothetical protein
MILDNVHQLDNLKGKTLFVYPILKDGRLHKAYSSIIGYVFIDVQTKETFTISNSHPEAVCKINDLSFLDHCKVYCYDIIALKYAGLDVSKFTDVKMQYYLLTNQGYNPDTPSIVSHYTRMYPNCLLINELISLSKHEEFAMQAFEESWIKEDQPGISFYQNNLIDVFFTIEKQGLNIDTALFEERFGNTFSKNGNRCYTEYNFYTTTGRPSNRFGGINFAALNKEDSTRECFVSEKGSLVEIDFNSYHPRLIASIVGYDFGKDNVYEHLAKHYHNTHTPTKEQIKEAKEATFRQFYGGIQKQYLHIPFFEATNNLAQMLWRDANDKGYIESPISGRRLILSNYQDINCYVLFNYFVQMYETEHNVMLLTNIFRELDSDIVPILYTYDSILFDLPTEKQEKLKTLLEKIIPVTFPFKIKTGNNYKDLR